VCRLSAICQQFVPRKGRNLTSQGSTRHHDGPPEMCSEQDICALAVTRCDTESQNSSPPPTPSLTGGPLGGRCALGGASRARWSRIGHGGSRRSRTPEDEARHCVGRLPVPSVTCWYVSAVMLTEACPRRSLTTLSGTPAPNAAVADECRTSCRRMRGSSANVDNRRKGRTSHTGRVNTSPLSIHAGPAAMRSSS
jgi:hypothetical protein